MRIQIADKDNVFLRKYFLFIVWLYWLSLYIHIPYQTVFMTSIGISKSSVGLIIGIYGIAQVIFRIPLGLIADIGGKQKRFLVFGQVFLILAALSRSIFPNSIGFFFANLFSGISVSTWVNYMVYFMSIHTDSDIAVANGRILSMSKIGTLVAFIMGALLYDILLIQRLSLISAVVAFFAIFFTLRLKEKEQKAVKAPLKINAKIIFKTVLTKRLLLFSLVALCVQGMNMTTGLSFTSQFAKNLGANGFQVGICSAIYMLSASIAAFLSSKKYFLKHYKCTNIIYTLVALTGYCFMMPNTSSLIEIYLLQVIAGFAFGFTYSNVTSETMYAVKKEFRSTAMSVHQSIYAIGMTLLPILAGKMADISNLKTTYYSMSVFYIVPIILILMYRYSNIFQPSNYQIITE